ncbi:MAG: O-antigen ligase family protein [Clostridia bacterium]|nr:O-antigen ligase family protein [Clostridia bacterium]
MKRRLTLLDFFEYLMAVTFIINANSIYVHLPINENNLINYFLVIFMIVGVMGCFLYKNKVSVYRINKGITVATFFIIYCGFYILLRPNNIVGDLYLLVINCILIVYYFFCCNDYDIPAILFKFRNLICFIALVSIFMWVMCSIVSVIPQTGNVFSAWSDTGEYKVVPNFFYIYFETQKIDIFGFNNIIRNSAIFTEAPMASLNFSLALIIELFLCKKVSKKKVLIFIIAILTTFSMTGYILILMAFGIKLLLYTPKSNSAHILKLFLVPVCVVIVGYVGFNLLSEKLSSHSGSIRLDDFVAGYKAWQENIFFGTGGGEVNQQTLISYMSPFRLYNTGFSNSIMMILSGRGLYGGILYFGCIVKGLCDGIKQKNFNKFFFVVFFLYLFTITVIAYSYLTYFILIFLMNHKTSQNKNKSIRISSMRSKQALI